MKRAGFFCAVWLLSDCCTAIKAQPLKTPESIQQQTELLIVQAREKNPALQRLTEQQADFAKIWQELLRQQLIVARGAKPAQLSEDLGLMLALPYASQFFSRADDLPLDAYFQLQGQLIEGAQHDAALCGIILNTASARKDQQFASPWILNTQYAALKPKLLLALNNLVIHRADAWPRNLPSEQKMLFLQKIIRDMAQHDGQDSLKHYEQLHNENAGPIFRCQGLWQFHQSINRQDLELRAALVREFWH